MIHVAIVEDNDSDARMLENCLQRFQAEENTVFQVSRFADGMDFVERQKFDYDVIYMDIEMPLLNGMDTAKAMRDAGCRSALVFVTNMAQYAIMGYKVEAVDFVLKPIRYPSFSTMLKKLISRILEAEGDEVLFTTGKGALKLSLKTVRYVESEGHRIIFHTESGSVEMWGSMKKIQEKLPESRFIRCNNSYIINLSFVREIKIQSVALDNGDELTVSRNKRKELLDAYQHFLLGRGAAKFM